MTEAYCIKCRRMVPARKSMSGGVFVLADHYRFSTGDYDWSQCSGRISSSPVTHGMEDPKAAFRTDGRRAWGRIQPIRRGDDPFVVSLD